MSRIQVVSIPLDGGNEQPFTVAGNFEPKFVAEGNVVFAIGGMPLSMALASAAGGEILATTEGVRVVSVSPDGHWVFVQMPGATGVSVSEPLKLFDARTHDSVIVDTNYSDGGDTVFSPDSSSAVFVSGDAEYVLKRVTLATGTVETLGPIRDRQPHVLFSPDSTWLAYNDDMDLYVARSSGGPPALLTRRYGRSASALRSALHWLGSVALVTELAGLSPYQFQKGIYVLTPP